MLAEIFGYDKYSEITSEHAIRSTFCDLAVKLDGAVQLLLEVKAIGLEPKDQYVKQAVDYAANLGVDWVVLTNAENWRIYKVGGRRFAQSPGRKKYGQKSRSRYREADASRSPTCRRTLDQLSNRLRIVFDEILRPAVQVGERRGVGVDAQVVVERGEHLAERHRPVDRFAAQAVGRADHLPGPHAAAGQQRAVHLRPVVAARLAVDLRRAAELAPDDHRTSSSRPRSCRSSTKAVTHWSNDGKSSLAAVEDRPSGGRASPTCCS